MALSYFEKWKKFKTYKLSEHKEKGLYIITNARELEEYNPFEFSVEILYELLCIGLEANKNMNTSNHILEFINQYGFLGFGQSIIDIEYENGDAKLHENNPLDLSAIHYTDLMDLIFPFDKYSHRIIKENETRITILWSIKYPNTNNDSIIFHWLYSEEATWIERYAKFLYDSLLSFYEGRPFEHKLCNVKKYISFKDDLKEVWQFDSLKSAIDIMFVELLKFDKPKIKLCKRCKKPFIIKVQKSEYCSTSCRNILNVKNSRIRSKCVK